jgi:hypothetical protein
VPSGMASFQGLGMCCWVIPRALPWAVLSTPFRRVLGCIINAFQADSVLDSQGLSGGLTRSFAAGIFRGLTSADTAISPLVPVGRLSTA